MQIIDNALNKEDFDKLCKILMSEDFGWFYSQGVSKDYGHDGYYFLHTFYKNLKPNSSYFYLLEPLLRLLDAKALIRVKANLYPSSPELCLHNFHVDTPHKNLNAVFYINTNDGFTEFEQGDKVYSVANRLLLFDNKESHRSTNCTDMLNPRVTVNFNYFQ